jgi:hypothetical protein
MTYDQILSWQYANGVEDEWFVAVGGNPSPQLKSLLEIKAIKDNAPKLQIHVLHAISKDDPTAEWVIFESHEEIFAQSIPQRPIYNPTYNKFNATMEQMVNLAQRAIRKNGNTVTSVGHGFVAFETGMTWGSWSGASCSISIEEREPFWFVVRGSGKQNVRGKQLAAIDFGEAAGKAKAVISSMKTMAK